MLTREENEKRENDFLASYAMKSSESGGRRHKEQEHFFRGVYQRDKDRIIYSTAFRRLEYKTQVFVNHEGDYYRTRLTHTLEVAQIARTVARALRLNEELVEAIALAHDVGHTPFGHSGEEALGKLMDAHGGFDHNTHGLRVVDVLEHKYPDFCGLNLTEEVRRGIIRHSTPFDDKRTGKEDVPGPNLLEIQVVNICDEIAYDNHDLDDGLKSGFLTESSLKSSSLWGEAVVNVEKKFKNLNNDIKRYQIVRYLVNLQVSDVIDNALENIKNQGIKDVSSLDENPKIIVDFSDKMKEKRCGFKKVLMEKLYKHYRVVRMSNKAARFLTKIFEIYQENPEQLPTQYEKRVKEEGKHRVICDYIAGMTDRYALDQYKMFFEPYERG